MPIRICNDNQSLFKTYKKAESSVGTISSFQYQAPSGMICTQSPGQTDCEWTMTPEQLQVDSHSFCWDATDSLGLVAERRCLTIKVSKLITRAKSNVSLGSRQQNHGHFENERHFARWVR